jgi:hypothetical protein
MRDLASSSQDSAELEHPNERIDEIVNKIINWTRRIKNPFYKGINENANYPLLF